MNCRFPKSCRLLETAEFQRVYSGGQRISGQWLLAVCLSNQLPASRFGIVVGRKQGKAVKRNLLKRWMRETVRHHRESFAAGYDVVLLPKARLQVSGYASIASDFLKICSTLDLKKEIGIRHSSHSVQP